MSLLVVLTFEMWIEVRKIDSNPRTKKKIGVVLAKPEHKKKSELFFNPGEKYLKINTYIFLLQKNKKPREIY